MVKQMALPTPLVLLGPTSHGRDEDIVNVPVIPVENTCPRKFTYGNRESILKFEETGNTNC